MTIERHYLRRPEPDTTWMADAACKGSDPRLFWPDQGVSIAPALAVCNDCPVREQCLDYALDNGEEDGIWGGTSSRRRRQLRRERRQHVA